MVTSTVNCANEEYDRQRYLKTHPNAGKVNAEKTECKRGHSLSGENLYVNPKGERQCVLCQRERVKAHIASHPDSARIWHMRWRLKHPNWEKEYRANRREWFAYLRLRRAYGIEPDEAKAKLESQGWLCVVCKCDLHGKRICLDHDHATNTLREFVCDSCNKMLGFARDNADNLRKGADYLDKHS